MNQYLAWFDEIPNGELAMAAGGKGASLCRMSRAGLPVPGGFIVRSEMFNAYMEANGLWDYVFEKLETIDFSSDASLIAVSAEIRRKIIDCPVPQEMAEDIVKHYTQIGSGREPVAVRSSGTAEDLDDASFAGQQETFLFVIGNDDVVKFIKECWASLYNDRAIFYRREKKFDERSISIAVVVQRMVSAQKAGVMFTSNPITNDYNTVVLEAAWGLGEAIVSGIVTPDNLWIDRRSDHGVYLRERDHGGPPQRAGRHQGRARPRGAAGGPGAHRRRTEQAGGAGPEDRGLLQEAGGYRVGHRGRAGVSAPVPAYHHYEIKGA